MTSLETIWSRPGMYLVAFEPGIDAAAFFTNFIDAVTMRGAFGFPPHIDIHVAASNFSVTAQGCQLDELSQQPEMLTRIFDASDPDYNSLQDRWRGLQLFQPIVWFSEFCIVDISTSEEVMRQAFLNAQPISPRIRTPLGDQTPYLGFSFTLPHEKFSNTRLEYTYFRRRLSNWRRALTAYRKMNGRKFPKMTLQWRRISDYNYSLRITPSYEVNEPQVGID